jgi:hypothetical protein
VTDCVRLQMHGPAHRLLALLALGMALGACTGDDPPPAGPPPRACGEDGVTASPLTHLTRIELGYAAHDLFGADALLADRLPIDDSTTGFGVGASTSPLLVEQYFALAESAAAQVASDDASAHALTGCTDASEACMGAYLSRVGRRAFRRELTDVERSDLLGLYRAGAATQGFAGGVRLLVQGVLTSAGFLYHTEGSTADASGRLVRLDAFERASRLAFLVWRSVPDDALLDDAASGALETDDDLYRAAERMFRDERSSRMIDDFYTQWLALDRIDTAISTELTGEEVQAMHVDLSRYVEQVTRGGGFRDLLVPTDGIGVAAAAGGAPGEPLRGVLDAPGIMLVLSRYTQTDPIHRGLFVRERFLCQHLPPPPPGVIFSVPETNPDQTTRERFAVHTGQPACAGCHTLIDPIGFGFEHYDQNGRYREVEGTLAIDASGEIIDGDDASGTFDGAQELAARLADSHVARECFARQWFRFGMQRIETPADQCSIDTMMRDFYARDLRIEDLMLSITRTEAFQNRRIPVGE